jgi:nucleoside-diphosphate-sugar epimerase
VFQAHRDSVKDYVLLDDVVSLLPKIATNGRERVYNIASGVNISTLEIADLLKDTTGCSVEFLDSESCRKPMVVDISRIQNEFGFQPTSVLDYARTMLAKDHQ